MPGTGLVKSKAWGVTVVSPLLDPGSPLAIWGKYVNIDSPAGVLSLAAGDGGRLNDIRFWKVGVNTIWSPVRNLDLGLEVVYSHLNSRDNGSGLTPVASRGTASAGRACSASSALLIGSGRKTGSSLKDPGGQRRGSFLPRSRRSHDAPRVAR